MDKVYKSKSLSSGDGYQKAQNIKDHNIGKDVKGTMEKPVDGSFTKTTKNILYAPKTVSYAEFTNAKRNEKLQSMVHDKPSPAPTKEKIEDRNLSELPGKKNQKSFDVDVTKYKPRKAK